MRTVSNCPTQSDTDVKYDALEVPTHFSMAMLQ